MTVDSLQSQLESEQRERAAEQARHSAERARDEARVAEVGEALSHARVEHQSLLDELAASDEADVREYNKRTEHQHLAEAEVER